MKSFEKISLNGTWEMEYKSEAPIFSEEEPQVEGCIIEGAVPAYWEDSVDKFRETFLYERLTWNPMYNPQKYPIAGYVPDMVLPTVIGSFLYKRSFSAESLEGVSGCELYIGGAQNALAAWLNGVYLGRHEGYSSPFFFKIPQGLIKKGENTVVLAVSNTRLKGYMERPISGCTSRAANECTGGIYGDAEIRLYKSALRDVFVKTADDLSSFSVNVEAEGSAPDMTVNIYDGGSLVKSAVIPAGEKSVHISSDGLEYWSVDNPKRYKAVVCCEGEQISRMFGIRRLTAEGTKLLLNGKYIYLRGICEHGYYPMTVHPPRDKGYYRKVILTLKELGFNFIRFHTWVPMAEYMEAADELGMLMEVETPNNTAYEEWCKIAEYCRRYTAPVMYSSGNEMIIDEAYIEHLNRCADMIHKSTDSLFSPMSAMRGIEYYEFGDCPVEEPFLHNPKRLAALGEFCDLYNSYPNGQLSYLSASADPENIDRCNVIYKKPLLSHEICINGTYCDLSVKDRYKGTRIGETALFTSVEEHLRKKGLYERAPLYYRNSSEWQRRLRKQCFEAARRSESLAGYDYLGDIDHHWHTFGYHVGMMNEFYELKPGETVENTRRYNSDAVLLADLPYSVNYECGRAVKIPLCISNYKESFEKGTLYITLKDKERVYLRRQLNVGKMPAGRLTELTVLNFVMPKSEKPLGLTLQAELFADGIRVENIWELYAFPKAGFALPSKKEQREQGAIICEDISEDALTRALKQGKRVLLLGKGPFATLKTSWQIALAGRTAGHLGTVINDSPLMADFPHEGFCSWQFRGMLDGGESAVLDFAEIPFEPIVESVSTYKYAHREALIFEYRVGEGRLAVCTLNLDKNDAGARWLRERLVSYVMSEEFEPKHELSFAELEKLFNTNPIYVAENTNMARNTNDITA